MMPVKTWLDDIKTLYFINEIGREKGSLVRYLFIPARMDTKADFEFYLAHCQSKSQIQLFFFGSLASILKKELCI